MMTLSLRRTLSDELSLSFSLSDELALFDDNVNLSPMMNSKKKNSRRRPFDVVFSPLSAHCRRRLSLPNSLVVLSPDSPYTLFALSPDSPYALSMQSFSWAISLRESAERSRESREKEGLIVLVVSTSSSSWSHRHRCWWLLSWSRSREIKRDPERHK